MKSARDVEDEMAVIASGSEEIKLILSIPGINVYSAVAIWSEIRSIDRFKTKEKLASYAGLVPRQYQSGNRDIKGHITKHGPSMLRYVLILAAHSIIIKEDEIKVSQPCQKAWKEQIHCGNCKNTHRDHILNANKA